MTVAHCNCHSPVEDLVGDGRAPARQEARVGFRELVAGQVGNPAALLPHGLLDLERVLSPARLTIDSKWVSG